MNGYDIIGDIHGCAQTLHSLLKELGYREKDSIYQHELRKVIFLGDFIDRGPHQRETIEVARKMVGSGSALAVMGNHEFNAIAYSTFDESEGDYLRKHNTVNRRQHEAFLAEYENSPDEYRDVIRWFMSLPLWLDLGELRVVHACWDERAMARLRGRLTEDYRLTDELLRDVTTYGSQEFRDLETLIKGKEVPLKNGNHIVDNDGHKWPNIRIRWWEQNATTYQSAFMGKPAAIAHIPDDKIEGDHLIEYGRHLPPVFLGHYWMSGTPAPLAENIACVDYSVAKPGGALVAYRWDGEQNLLAEHFTMVTRCE